MLFSSLYQLLVPRAQCYKWTKPDTLQFKWKTNHSRAILWWQNTHFFSVFPIEGTQHVTLFSWTGSQNESGFLFASDYRPAGDDMVRIKHCVCQISSTVMVVMKTCLTVVFALFLATFGHLWFW